MKLVLETTRVPAGVPSDRREVEQASFRIGRGGESEWTLPDPDRVLSKCHCRFVSIADGWSVFDTSRNGTLLNGRPLDPGVPAVLQDGDRLSLGGYEIRARLEAGAPAGNRPEPGRESTEDPFPFPGTDEFGFLLIEGGSGAPFEPVAGDGPFPGTFGVGADRVSDLNEHIRLPRPTSDLLPEDWDAPLPERPAPSGSNAGSLPGADAGPEPELIPNAPVLPFPYPGSTTGDPAMVAGGAAGTDAAPGFAAFAAGAGSEAATVDDPAVTLRALGEAFAAMVHELRRTMMARAAIKGELRIEQTMIRPAGNNPLKFAVDDADALSALLGTGRRVGMTPRRAVADALRDIRLHELAVMTAMQHAVRTVVAELAPSRIRDELPRASLDGMPGRREARLWQAFQSRHEALTAALGDSFDDAFGRSFVRAYEAALREAEEADPVGDDQAAGKGGHRRA